MTGELTRHTRVQYPLRVNGGFDPINDLHQFSGRETRARVMLRGLLHPGPKACHAAWLPILPPARAAFA
jgi:hypothetical protein